MGRRGGDVIAPPYSDGRLDGRARRPPQGITQSTGRPCSSSHLASRARVSPATVAPCNGASSSNAACMSAVIVTTMVFLVGSSVPSMPALYKIHCQHVNCDIGHIWVLTSAST
jgi:hypothetical protein